MKISIGILSYKRTDLLIETISCLNNKNNKNLELIILNNNEDKCIYNDVLSCLPENMDLNYIWDKCNYGVSTGRNLILNNCTGDVIIILDDDVFIEDFDSILKSVLNDFSSDDELSAIAFNIKDFSTKKHNRYEIPHKNKNIDLDEDFYTYMVIGAGNAIKVKDALSVGNFATDFGLYGFEEIDLSFRLINLGKKIKYNHKCNIYHKKSPDGRFSNKSVNYLYFVNRSIMAKRYFNFKYFISCFLVRSLFFIYKTKDFKLYLKAVNHIFKDKKKNQFSKRFYSYIKKVNGFIWY